MSGPISKKNSLYVLLVFNHLDKVTNIVRGLDKKEMLEAAEKLMNTENLPDELEMVRVMEVSESWLFRRETPSSRTIT